MHASPERAARHSNWSYRWVLPAAGLTAFGIIASLRLTGHQAACLALYRFFGFVPGPIPFLDMHTLLAAAECRRQGIDVYLANPCMLGLNHVYSPLWLAVLPPALRAAATPWAASGLELLFIAALPIALRPRSIGELAVLAIAVLSPVTVFAFERGNNDLLIFLLVLSIGLLQGGARPWRLWSYPVLIGAALLKYYPAVLVLLAARERRRDAILIGLGFAVALGLLAFCYDSEILRALANLPNAPFYADSFSAKNLPFGLFKVLLQLPYASAFAIASLALLAAVALAWAGRAVALLEAIDTDWTALEMRLAAIGSLLLSASFFAGQNVNYRGIYFLLVLPGLVQLRRAARNDAAIGFLSRLIAAVLFLMWSECFRRALREVVAASAGAAIGDALDVIVWVLRELVWWWAIAALAAIAFRYFARLPLFHDTAGRLHRYWPGLGHRMSFSAEIRPPAEP